MSRQSEVVATSVGGYTMSKHSEAVLSCTQQPGSGCEALMLSKVWRAGNSARASLAAAAAGSGSDWNANVWRSECARVAGVGCERRVSAVLEVGTIASRCFEHIDYNTNTNTKYTDKYTYKSDICILALLTNVVTVLHRPSGSRHLGGGVSDVSSRPYTTISNSQQSTVCVIVC
jgi:hypothetical protein